ADLFFRSDSPRCMFLRGFAQRAVRRRAAFNIEGERGSSASFFCLLDWCGGSHWFEASGVSIVNSLLDRAALAASFACFSSAARSCGYARKLFSMAALNWLDSRQLLAPSFSIVVCDDCAPADFPGDEPAGFDLAVYR